MSTNRYTAILVMMAAIATLTICPNTVFAYPEVEECITTGQGEPCVANWECQSNTLATVCVDETCQIPCVNDKKVAEPSRCSMGETCVQGETENGMTHYCKSAKFVMDLNLLDSCIAHFLNGDTPDLSSKNECKLERNLNRMLDQDNNGKFNIYDVDACVRNFLQEQPCDSISKQCLDGQVYCDQNSDCGFGLFCNADMNRCERECGFIVNRAEENLIETLERKCSGRMKICDYYKGRCIGVELEDSTCQVDRDCPAGAYCFLGVCEPSCYRSIDCPDSNWYCSKTNICLPKPRPSTEDEEPFNPKEYSVQFARKKVSLDSINDEYAVPLVIMNLKTKKQVFDSPNVVFGYRLEIKYARKQEQKCLGDISKLPPEDFADCIIGDNEEFITLKNPYGTVYGDGDPTIDIGLNAGIVDKLSPGFYEATITAMYNNGNVDSVTVSFQKTSPNGEYIGKVSVYVDGPDNLLGTTTLNMKLQIDMDQSVEWDTLLQQNNLSEEKDFIDVTKGHVVTGYIHGNDSPIFNWPGAEAKQDNQIPVKGIYADHLGRMKLVAVIDLAEDFCRDEKGKSVQCQGNPLSASNPFKRKIRRLLHFVGPYDATQRKFHGMYRETISGLTSYDVTLDGGFIVNQVKQDDTPVATMGPLLPPADPKNPGKAAPVGFQQVEDILAAVQKEIDDKNGVCWLFSLEFPTIYSEALNFSNATVFNKYLKDQGRKAPIFKDMVRLEEKLQDAVDVLSADNNAGKGQDASLTINEFLKGKVVFCSSEVTENCIDRKAAECGLLLYKKAILSSWLNYASLGISEEADAETPNPEHALFCPKNPPLQSDCGTPAIANPSLFALQEHNRFYKEITQALAYQAGNDLSDAFFAMYKAADGDPLDKQVAFDYKDRKLVQALASYNEIRKKMFATAATQVFFNWPMAVFNGKGISLIEHMQTVISDRMDTMTELFDIRRRVSGSTDEKSYVFVQHLLHEEYLSQVYLIALQKQWEKESFRYTGQAQKVFDKGANLMAKVNDTRNPLGLHPSRVYFDNSIRELTNWQNYKRRIDQALPDARNAVMSAIEEMKASLADQNELERNLLLSQHDIDAKLDEMCGENLFLPSVCETSSAGKAEDFECYPVNECENDECESIKAVCQGKDIQSIEEKVACRTDVDVPTIKAKGGERNCVGGRMGALLQEKILLQTQRENLLEKFSILNRQILRQQKYINDTHSENKGMLEYLKNQNNFMTIMEESIFAADLMYQISLHQAEGAECIVIVGLATGTNCPQSLISAGIKNTALVVKDAIVSQANVAMSIATRKKEIEYQDKNDKKELLQLRMSLDNMGTEAENLVAEYKMVAQQLFNVELQIADTQYIAQNMADRHKEVIGSLIDRLVGFETGSVLRRNRMVKESNEKFLKLLIETYKMAVAFVHRYNLKEVESQIMNQVYKLVTLDDVQDFVAELVEIEENYCGTNGLDCDSKNNQSLFKFSVQKELFPELRDIVDPKTGRTLTVGQQFHNIITSSTYLKRSVRETRIQTQIEIPFAIWANDRGAAGKAPQRYMLPENECNHIIVGEKTTGGQGGTIAVNILGTRLGLDGSIKYELWRGNTDYIRSCEKKISDHEFATNTYIVGNSPASKYGQMDTPPSFVSHTKTLDACVENPGLNDVINANNVDACFNYFARDRSLAAPDWKLVIPYIDTTQNWLLGDGLAENAKPIIEDIVLYIRHNARPN